MKLSKKALAYLRLIGQTEDASVQLTRGFAKQAQELNDSRLAVFIPISRCGCHVALTREGIDLYEEEVDRG